MVVEAHSDVIVKRIVAAYHEAVLLSKPFKPACLRVLIRRIGRPRLRSLHTTATPLRLANVWDAATAKLQYMKGPSR